MKEKYKPPRGMNDIGPEEMRKRKLLYGIMRRILDSYGYEEVEPVHVEMFETLAAKSGEDVKNEIYYFEDKKGRKLGLRFDLSVGITRMVASMVDKPLPIRLYCISNMWRYDAPQRGRRRCFYQWDIEIYGSKSPSADAEVLEVAARVLEELGIDLVIRISNRKIAEGIIRYLGVDEEEKIEAALRAVDKIRKMGRQKIIREMVEAGIEKVVAEEILNALAREGEPEKVLSEIKREFPVEEEETLARGVEELEGLARELSVRLPGKRIVFDLSIVRGLGYYTGNVFEAYDPEDEDLGAIIGGGRFDTLGSIYGRDIPAVGLAGGIERLMEVLDKKGSWPREEERERILVATASTSENVKKKAIELADRLRREGAMVETDVMERKLSQQLRYADKKGFSHVIVIGEKELEEGKARKKNMETGEEVEIEI